MGAVHLLLDHWSYDPLLPVAVGLAAVHDWGVYQLNRRSSRARARRRRQRSLWFHLGLIVLLVAVESPVDYWSDAYFWVHMLQHLLLIFAVPPAILAGAPWQPLQHAIPAAVRRPVMRALLVAGWSAPMRRAGAWLRSPWVGVVGLNAVVVLWHLPAAFDLAEQNDTVHVCLMHASFFALGVLFWAQLIPSPPLRIRLGPVGQIAAVFATATIMWILAIALSLFSSSSWYPWYRVHEGPMLPAFADQQIGAGIMWTSGIFWALPTVIVAVRRLIDQEGPAGAEAHLDRLLRGHHSNVYEQLAWRSPGMDLPPSEAGKTTMPWPRDPQKPAGGPRRPR